MYKPGKHHANADAFSRLPMSETAPDKEITEQVLMVDVLADTLIDTTQIKRWTSKDVILSQVYDFTWIGWPAQTDVCFKPYQQRKFELSVRDGCVLWGAKVIIPTKGRDKILRLLHQTHLGISKMKGLARSYVCWPGMDEV